MDLYERNTCSFIVKVWLEPNNAAHWRGHITHVFTGQRRYFENLATITNFIATYLEEMGLEAVGRKPDQTEPLAGGLPCVTD